MVPVRSVCVLLVFWSFQAYADWSGEEERLIDAKTAIKYVNDVVENGTCTGGTENTLKLQFDHQRWESYARIAIKTANLLAKLLVQNGTLVGVDEMFLFSAVRNNIQGDNIVFGSAIAFEEYVFPGKRIFCPYANMKGRVAEAFDLAEGYDYMKPDVEWYAAIKNRDYANVTVLTDVILENSSTVMYSPVEAMATLGDGRWTYPYFDCGGGDIWMVTYSSPILGIRNTSGQTEIWFRGVATIDIELTNIDVNQCDLDGKTRQSGSGSLDVFRGTHSCQPTTTCQALTGYGFRRGSYICVCEKGYYFPDTLAKRKAFNGSVIESYYDTHNVTGDVKQYQCLKCARGCDACVDATPCMIAYNVLARVCILLLSIILMIAIGVTAFVTHQYKSERVIKSASPIFLQITLLGCAFMNCQMFLLFAEPTDLVCMITPWFAYVGFTLAYGALLLKTWRISTIFRYGTTKRVNLPDKVLLQWFLPLLVCAVVFLTAWTAVDPPVSQVITTDSGLKYVFCTNHWWFYAAKAAEVALLLWGVYLSFTVRKAPSQFNESKYISWSIYNAVLLGTFMVVIIQFIALPTGPDIVYALTFLYLQIRVTMTLCLFFAPKFYSLYKLIKYPELADAEETNGRTMLRTTVATISNSNSKLRKHASNQTALSWVDSNAPVQLGDSEKGTTTNVTKPVISQMDQLSVKALNGGTATKGNQVAPEVTVPT